jgi:isoleucyl-tRNA synthetase
MAVSSSNEAEGLRLDGLGTEEAAAAVVRWLQNKGRGAAQTNYKLRDWLFARQRYWGEPFPIVFEEGSEVCVPHDCTILKTRLLFRFIAGSKELSIGKLYTWDEACRPLKSQRKGKCLQPLGESCNACLCSCRSHRRYRSLSCR